MADGGTILIVDDETTNIEILAELLETDYEIVFATGGQQALDLAALAQPDLILLDVMMQGMDGYEVCERLKQSASTKDCAVIFITALGDTAAETRGLMLGAVDYVTKPINPTVVRVRVRNHIELKRARDALARMAATDGLTGLANRRRFDEVIGRECQRLARTNSPLSLILLDIDHFKAFNDTYGHVAGDDCLRRVGGAIGAVIHRTPDLAARYGGEEFACILPDTAQQGALAVANQILAQIASLDIPHSGSSAASFVTASLGVTTIACTPNMAPESVVAAADSCLYKAKAGGRNRVTAE